MAIPDKHQCGFGWLSVYLHQRDWMESTCPRKGRVALSFVSKCLHLGLTLHVVTRCLASDDASATKRLPDR